MLETCLVFLQLTEEILSVSQLVVSVSRSKNAHLVLNLEGGKSYLEQLLRV